MKTLAEGIFPLYCMKQVFSLSNNNSIWYEEWFEAGDIHDR